MPFGSGFERGTPSMTIEPASGRTKPAIMFMQRRLAAARWADDGDELAVTNREADVLDDRQPSLVGLEALLQVADFDLSAHSAT